MFSSNWQDLAFYIIQNKHTMKPMDLHTMNQRLKGALEMQAVQNMNNGMQNIGNSAASSWDLYQDLQIWAAWVYFENTGGKGLRNEQTWNDADKRSACNDAVQKLMIEASLFFKYCSFKEDICNLMFPILWAEDIFEKYPQVYSDNENYSFWQLIQWYWWDQSSKAIISNKYAFQYQK